MKADEKQQILETDSLVAKLQAIATALNREIALLELKGKIESAAQEEMSDAQRQYFLRQQLKAIQDELGEGDKPEAQELRKRIAEAKLPAEVATVASREVDRLERMTPASPEYQMIRTYIDWVLDVPWSTMTEDRLDPVAARQVLDEDHYDLNRALHVSPEFLETHDLHVHVPAGAIPKDGPSAGVTIATAIVSALRNQPVRQDVAMTGEITLSGLVLPVGGIREKALAARRYGITTFVLPARNEPDLAELPPEVRKEMRFVPADTLEEVLEVALPR
jgi:ATP-dependent Lon protease